MNFLPMVRRPMLHPPHAANNFLSGSGLCTYPERRTTIIPSSSPSMPIYGGSAWCLYDDASLASCGVISPLLSFLYSPNFVRRRWCLKPGSFRGTLKRKIFLPPPEEAAARSHSNPHSQPPPPVLQYRDGIGLSPTRTPTQPNHFLKSPT